MIFLAIALAAQPVVVTIEDICLANEPDVVIVTDETGLEIECPRDPPPGWDVGNSFAKDGCTNDALASDAACYAAWLREGGGYPPDDDRCTWRYQRWTREAFRRDDKPNCQGGFR